MGGALVRGLARAEGFSPDCLYVSNPSSGKLDALKNEYPSIHVSSDNKEVVKKADWVILAVKPWLVEKVVKEIKPVLDYQRQVVLSVAANVDAEQLSDMLRDEKTGKSLPVFYVMPNTAVAVGEGMILFTGKDCSDVLKAEAERLFSLMGRSLYMAPDRMEAGMMLSGCGIAYAMRYIRVAQEAGVEMGIYPKDALAIVLQTVKGATALLQATGNHPESEIDKVTTPGGVTIKGLNEMEHAGFSSAVIRGHKAGLRK